MHEARCVAVLGAAMVLLLSTAAYADSHRTYSDSHRTDSGRHRSCELKRLQAAHEYAECFYRVEQAVLTQNLSLGERLNRIDACAGKLTNDLEQASRRTRRGEDECTVPVDVSELRSTLDNAQLDAFQLATQSSGMSCTHHDNGKTLRCVFTASETLDLDTLMSNQGLGSDNPSTVLITAEIYGGEGNAGNGTGAVGGGGEHGEHGYASTTWSWQAFKDNGSSTHLYLYVGDQPSCGACGGSSSMILFSPLTGIVNASDTTSVLGLAGGSGGGGSAGDTKAGRNGGDGGVAIASGASTVFGDGGAGAGGQSGSGGGQGTGGAGSTSCSGATAGGNGVGGFGGVKQDNSDSDRAGWRSSGLSFSDWESGDGGIGIKSDSGANGAGGGGGYGGGGGGCERGGGGGGSSMVVGYNGVLNTATFPATCGPTYHMPDNDGQCNEGGHKGKIVLDILPNAQ